MKKELKRLIEVYKEAYDYWLKESDQFINGDRAHDFAITCVSTLGNRTANHLTLGAEVNGQTRKAMMQSMSPHLEVGPPTIDPRMNVNAQHVTDEVMKKFKEDPLEDWRQNGYSETKS